MKSLLYLAILILTTFPAKAAPDIRSDLEKDIPLSTAVERFNRQYPDANPLTEDEVMAAVRTIRSEYPKIDPATYRIYERVLTERVLPRGMYFSHLGTWITPEGHFKVDWKDLTLTPMPSSLNGERIESGFNYRIRARFISSRPLTEAEMKEFN